VVLGAKADHMSLGDFVHSYGFVDIVKNQICYHWLVLQFHWIYTQLIVTILDRENLITF